MIKLYQFSPLWNLPNASIFCLKLETYLRMANLPFQSVYTNNPRKAPKGKLPYIEDDGRKIADSNLIINYLKQKYGDPLDNDLSAEEGAKSLAIKTLFEEYLYWIMMYSRWIDPQIWPQFNKEVFGKMSAPLKWFIPSLARKKISKQLAEAGMGRHSREEIYAMASEAIQAIATLLGKQPYLLGSRPHSIDATAYGLLANILYSPLDTPLKKYAQQYPNLIVYCHRIKEKYFAQN